jgi:hypothetical protein
MTVILGDKTLSTTDAEFTGTELFPGNIENGSAVLPLTISQTTKGILKTGQYSGVVSLMLTQATTTEGGA